MDFQKFLICVIEDNNSVNKLLSTVLEKANFDCKSFHNGQDALDWLNNNKPSAILIDIFLPDIHGTQLLKIIRGLEDFGKIPIIALTGLSGALTKENMLSLGFDYFIQKPINITTFPDEIKSIINSNKNH